jgi:hypothetical protein
MRYRTALQITLVAVGLAVAVREAGAIFCNNGAQVNVCVKNPTNTTPLSLTISGAVNSGESTCGTNSNTVPAVSYSESHTVTVINGQTQCFTINPAGTGLVSGMWTHHINVSSTGQSQHQQVPVIWSTTKNAEVDWVYYPHVITVNKTGDTSGTCQQNCPTCGNTCDIRHAVQLANSVTGGTAGPVLIQFTVSPGTIDNGTFGGPLVLGNLVGGPSGSITIDGTDANGNPAIVGDANAAAAGSQDAFPRVVSFFRGANGFVINSSDNVIQGLAIKHALASSTTQQTTHVISIVNPNPGISTPPSNNVIRRVQLDGGNRLSCALVRARRAAAVAVLT